MTSEDIDGSPGAGRSLVAAFDHVWSRFTDRLAGLGNDEYFWAPLPGCWSLRRDQNGRWTLDGHGGDGPAPDPLPITTIAWRIGHVGGLALGGFAARRFGDGAIASDDIEFPGRAPDVHTFLDGNYRRWRDGLVALSDAEWWLPLGEGWGPYAESSTADLALHVLDELVHHGAEIGLLRDLYLHRAALG
ncbi:MAG: hypothetical protein JWL73_802 [Actinomycetia bacterium]|nr:hypothetical protein [Actinomycetes bacterium]